MSTRANTYKFNRPAMDALAAAGKAITSVSPKLRALIELRVSQINGCVYCVDAHANEARAAGETQQRLDLLCVWQEGGFFDDAERAALQWAEALTDIEHTHAPDGAYAALKPHYSDQQIADLTAIVSIMNAWNRIALANRTMPAVRR